MEFSVPVVRIEEIFPIEGADKIEAARVGDYQTIVAKGEYKPGDLVAYIPESSVVPDGLLEEMGLKGKLSGTQKNRVKAVKLKGVLSQGLVYPYSKIIERANFASETTDVEHYLGEGTDVSGLLGITKYEPAVPAGMEGTTARPRGNYALLNYDIENIKGWPNVFTDNEYVSITEKIHGTLMQAAFFPHEGEFGVSSKGLGKRGFLIADNAENAGNLYIKVAKRLGLERTLPHLVTLLEENGFSDVHAVFVVGEVFGKGVQDLNYGVEPSFRVFDIYVGVPGHGCYLTVDQLKQFTDLCDLHRVPELFRGGFSKQVVDTLTSGVEAISGTKANMREGVVVRPVVDRQHRGLGRVILKSVSEEYLLRKGGTEYN